jgi:hypothetical protein
VRNARFSKRLQHRQEGAAQIQGRFAHRASRGLFRRARQSWMRGGSSA